MERLVYAAAALLVALWLLTSLLSFVLRYVISPLVHLLLIVALVLWAYNFFFRRRER